MTAPLAIDAEALRCWPLPAFAADAGKEERGRVVVVAGSREIAGAAWLAGVAALRAGAGKLVVATVDSAAVPLALALPEARVIGLAQTAAGAIDPTAAERLFDAVEAADALLVGPGMVDEGAACALARALLPHCRGPAILDAAAMGACSAAAGALLLTPHVGEMAHLCGSTKAVVQADLEGSARSASARWQAVVALKGARTVIAAPDGRAWHHSGGSAGLGTAGSGDVLAGIVAGLAARGAALEQAAAWGVFVHARAGARLAQRIGSLGFLARELPAEVPALLDHLGAGAPSSYAGGAGSDLR